MFAVIKTGGKQYKVAENDIISIESLTGSSGDVIEFDKILMVAKESTVKVGTPTVTKAKVFATILEQIRDDKIIVFKKKRRNNYRRKQGHRQNLTTIQITDILPEGGSAKNVALALSKKSAKSKAAKVEAKVTSEKKATEKKPQTKTATEKKPITTKSAEKKVTTKATTKKTVEKKGTPPKKSTENQKAKKE